MENFEILLTSAPDRDNIVAEISYKKYVIAEINVDDNIPKIEFFSYPDVGDLLQLPLEDFQVVLEKAKKRLLG